LFSLFGDKTPGLTALLNLSAAQSLFSPSSCFTPFQFSGALRDEKLFILKSAGSVGGYKNRLSL
jgi:hypothetical protein